MTWIDKAGDREVKASLDQSYHGSGNGLRVQCKSCGSGMAGQMCTPPNDQYQCDDCINKRLADIPKLLRVVRAAERVSGEPQHSLLFPKALNELDVALLGETEDVKK